MLHRVDRDWLTQRLQSLRGTGANGQFECVLCSHTTRKRRNDRRVYPGLAIGFQAFAAILRRAGHAGCINQVITNGTDSAITIPFRPPARNVGGFSFEAMCSDEFVVTRKKAGIERESLGGFGRALRPLMTPRPWGVMSLLQLHPDCAPFSLPRLQCDRRA